MFYGAIVKPGTTVSLNPEDGEVLHLSGACLHGPVGDERTYLVLQQDAKSHILCVLRKDIAENVPLDLFVATREGGHFKVQGKSEVHLTGYYEPMMSSDSEDDDDFDDSDDAEEQDVSEDNEDDEKTLEALQGAAADKKKKKVASGDVPALVAAEASEDDTDEDNEDDSDDDIDSDSDGEEPKKEGEAGSSDLDGLSDDDDKPDEDDDDDEEDDEEAIRQAIQQQLQQKKAESKADKKKQPKAMMPPTSVPATSDSGKKRKAAEPVPPAKPGKQQKPATAAAGVAGIGHFEKAITDYLKKHGRCLISQVASACPKPASVTSKYREFLVSRPTFTVEGQHVVLKA